MQEIWKVYKITQRTVWEVSNYGNVKKNGKLYECRLNGYGYKRFGRGVCLHKVVAELFIPNPENKKEVDHIDTDKLNNHVDNLQWVTRKENNNNPLTLQHMSEVKIGKYTGEKHPMAINCVYNGIEFGCIKDAWRYAKENNLTTVGWITFYKHFKG